MGFVRFRCWFGCDVCGLVSLASFELLDTCDLVFCLNVSDFGGDGTFVGMGWFAICCFCGLFVVGFGVLNLVNLLVFVFGIGFGCVVISGLMLLCDFGNLVELHEFGFNIG